MISKNFPETKITDNKSNTIIEKAPLSTLLSDCCEKKDKKEIIKEIEELLKKLL